MNKYTYVLLQNLLVMLSIAGLYYLTKSNWSFLCLILAQVLAGSENES
jgi:hypothetical protein